jgi:SMI1 / KNR4 family (SUKH-1)
MGIRGQQSLQESAMHDEARYRALCERIRAWHQEQSISFVYLPATEEQVRETEAQLGLPLPPLLRMLYTEVANGGNLLSPHYPFFGVVGGCPITFWGDDNKTFGHTLSRSGWRLHPCMAEALERFPGYMALSDSRPEGFVLLSDQGCGTALEYDLVSGQIYLTGAGPDIPTDDPGEDAGWMTTITFMAPSLEDCLNAMVAGTLYDHIRAESGVSEQDIDSYIESSCSDETRAVWRGLYRFSPGFFTPQEPNPETWDDE